MSLNFSNEKDFYTVPENVELNFKAFNIENKNLTKNYYKLRLLTYSILTFSVIGSFTVVIYGFKTNAFSTIQSMMLLGVNFIVSSFLTNFFFNKQKVIVSKINKRDFLKSSREHVTKNEIVQICKETKKHCSINYGVIEALVTRKRSNMRMFNSEIEVNDTNGISNDFWGDLENRDEKINVQISICNSFFLSKISKAPSRVSLAGGNILADVHLQNVNPGDEIYIISKDETDIDTVKNKFKELKDTEEFYQCFQNKVKVKLGVTEKEHTGCAKFQRRYGKVAREYINSEALVDEHFRGLFTSVSHIKNNTTKVSVGDIIVIKRSKENKVNNNENKKDK